MNTEPNQSGGIQQLAENIQYVYLDFDGEKTAYRNDDLDLIFDVEVENSGMTETQKRHILSELSEKYANTDLVFTLEKPQQTAAYSTVFIGQTDAFKVYGDFTGLAETIDKGNKIKNDNAFVLADAQSDPDVVISVIEHEIGHITRGEKHEITTNNLYDYAYSVTNSGMWLDDVTINYTKRTYSEIGLNDAPLSVESSVGMDHIVYTGDGHAAYYNASRSSGISFVSTTSYQESRYKFVGIAKTDWLVLTITNRASFDSWQYNLQVFFYSSDCTLNPKYLCDPYVDNNRQRDKYLISDIYDIAPGEEKSIWVPRYDTVPRENWGDCCLFVGTWDAGKNVSISIPYSIEASLIRDTATPTPTPQKKKYVIRGTTSTGVIVSSGVKMYVSSGGTAARTTISSGGTMYVSRGGKAINTIVGSGYMFVYHGGKTISATVNYGGKMYLSSGGQASRTILNSGGHMVVSRGGKTISATVNYGGKVYLSSGGQASRTILNSSGYMYVSRGGKTISATVNYGGKVYLSSGGQASRTILNSGGHMVVSRGGKTISATVNYGGKMYVSSGGKASGTTVSSGGDVWVRRGGVMTSATVKKGGTVYVSSGGTALKIKENGGYVDVSAGAKVSFIANSFKNLTLSDWATVHSGTTAVKTKVNSKGHMVVSRGGKTISATVNSGGYVDVSSGGQASRTILNSSGYMWVSRGGKTISATVNSGGRMYISSGGTATGTTVKTGGRMYVFSGGTASKIKENGGYVVVSGGAKVSFIANSFKNLTLTNWATIHSGTTAVKIKVNSGGDLTVFKGGKTISASINYDGWMYLSSGGQASRTILNSKGHMVVSHGGKTISATVNYDGTMYVSSGGQASSTILNSSGYMYVLRGGKTISATANYGGKIYVYSGGQASSTILKSGAILHVSCGGSANGTTVYSAGWMYVSSGGTALKIKENGGYVDVSDGAKVSFIANSFSNVTLTKCATIHSGTTAVKTKVNSGGDLTVFKGGKMIGTILNAGGYMYVSSGGMATDTILNSGGKMWVSGGGAVSGSLQIADGAMVFTSRGAAIDFTVAEQQKNTSPLIANWNCITGGNDAVYTLTVHDDPEFGQYVLATGAADFDQSMTVRTAAGSEIGTLSVDGELTTASAVYSLKKESGSLVLSVDFGINPAIIVSGNATTWTAGNVTLAADFVSKSNVIMQQEYRINDGMWQNYTQDIVMTQNGTVTFHAVDDAGNETTKKIVVGKIDTTAPDVSVSGNPTSWAKSAKLTATFSDPASGIKLKQYSTDNKTWKSYTGTITVTKNATYYFKATDNAGNVKTTGVKVTKIDSTGPVITVSENPSGWTKSSSVKLTAKFSDKESGVKTKQYSLDNKTWTNYTGAFTVRKHSSVYFKSTDNLGNVSTQKVEVKIDTAAPTVTVKGNPSKWTNSAKLTATFKDDLSGVKLKQYSTDKKTWKTYSSALTVTKNGTYYFRAKDNAGNVSAVKAVKVTKVDSTAPTIKVSGNPSDWTTSAKLTATFSESASGIKLKQYSTDNKTWKSYTGAITVKKNATYYFKATDNAGNVRTKSVNVTRVGKGNNANDTWKKATAITGNSVSGWVGIGDLADYCKFAVTKKAQLKFDFDAATAKAVKNGDLNVVCLDANGKNVSLVWDTTGQDFVTKSKIAAGNYILGVTDPVEDPKGIDYKIAIKK